MTNKWLLLTSNSSRRLWTLHVSDLRNKSADLSAVVRPPVVTSGRIGPLPVLVLERFKHSKQLIYLSPNEFLILPVLF